MAEDKQPERKDSEEYSAGLSRAFGGAIIFGIPLFMTMEMWWLGFYLSRIRLALLLLLFVPVLIGLAYHIGFERDRTFKDAVLDAFAAYAVGWGAAALVLISFAVVTFDAPWDDVLGKITLQAMAGSFGALIARGILGSGKKSGSAEPGYGSIMFMMAIGAIYLALQVAPTQEMLLIPQKMSNWHAVALAALSLTLMHAFVYAMEFKGAGGLPEGTPAWSVFLRFTAAGYALALLISLYILWTFGRTEGLHLAELVQTVVVLGFPAAIGAAAARLIL